MAVKRSITVAIATCAAAFFSLLAHPAAADGDQARLRFVLLSSDAPAVDFYVDGVRAWSGVGYKTVSNYITVAAGAHEIQIRPSGAPTASTAVAAPRHTLKAGSYYSVVAAGQFSKLRTDVLEDGFIASPPTNYCEARFLHAALEVPAVDVALEGGPTLYHNVSFMRASDYVVMPKGVYNIQIRLAGTNQVIFTVRNFDADGGHIHTLAAAGGEGRPVELVAFYDAAFATESPEDGADTGGGGLMIPHQPPTRSSPSTPWMPVGLGGVGALAVLAAAGALMLGWRRRHARIG